MKLLWYHFVQSYVTLGFTFYYKKTEATFLERIPKDKAIIFLSNHQNALLDPMLLTIKSTRENYFLTRAGVFSNPIAAKLLRSIQMLPIYRIRDGVDTIKKNKEIFTFCAKVLNEKKSIILFPEGNHSLKRRVRPLKKGFLRILEETLQTYPNIEVIIIPVGVNYQNPTQWGDTMSVNFGKHISSKQYWKDNKLDFNNLSKEVSLHLKQLTTHIDSISDYDETLEKLNDLQVDFTTPFEVNTCLQNNFKYAGNTVTKPPKLFYFFKALIKLIYFFPYYVWKKIAFPKIKEIEFIATFRFAILISITPIYILLVAFIISQFFGNIIGLSFLFVAILLPLITLKIK